MLLYIQELILMISSRLATVDDIQLYFDWANDKEVRAQSFNSSEISFDTHSVWFLNKINDKKYIFLVFADEQAKNIGQVRFQLNDEDNAVIGLSVAAEHRGMGYASKMIRMASNIFFDLHQEKQIYAYVKKTNEVSLKSFIKVGFNIDSEIDNNGIPAYLLILKNLHKG
jgi:RimJ/RimL family protein N-acetyltransferase